MLPTNTLHEPSVGSPSCAPLGYRGLPSCRSCSMLAQGMANESHWRLTSVCFWKGVRGPRSRATAQRERNHWEVDEMRWLGGGQTLRRGPHRPSPAKHRRYPGRPRPFPPLSPSKQASKPFCHSLLFSSLPRVLCP